MNEGETMNWLAWSILSAVFAAATAILAKLGVVGIDSNAATAIRTSVVLVFAWLMVGLTGSGSSVQGIPTPRVDVSHLVRRGDGILMDMLFSGAAIG